MHRKFVLTAAFCAYLREVDDTSVLYPYKTGLVDGIDLTREYFGIPSIWD